MTNVANQAEINLPDLDDKTKKEIEEIISIMKNIDEAGRALLIRDGNTLLARQQLVLLEKQPKQSA